MKKLIGWFEINIRTFKHIDNKKADMSWLTDTKRRAEMSRQSLPPPDYRNHPQMFIRRGEGTGGHHINRII